MTEWLILIFILLGLLSGLLGGLLGIGGGVITVPILYFIFYYLGLFESKTMQVAVSTSLAAGFATSAFSTYLQLRKKAVLFSVAKLLVPTLILGCISGALTAHWVASGLLKLIFGVMAILLGTYFFFPRLPHLRIRPAPDWTLSLFGLIIGFLSSLLGIGGGSLTFPVLLGYQLPAHHASGTSSLSTCMTTFFGSITFLLIAWHQPELPHTFGYIEWPAFLAISIGALLTSPLGVKGSHTLNISLIKQIFGASLALVGLSMLSL